MNKIPQHNSIDFFDIPRKVFSLYPKISKISKRCENVKKFNNK